MAEHIKEHPVDKEYRFGGWRSNSPIDLNVVEPWERLCELGAKLLDVNKFSSLSEPCMPGASVQPREASTEKYWTSHLTRGIHFLVVTHHETDHYVKNCEAHAALPNLDWVDNSEEVLKRLDSDSTTEDDRITAVLFAETMSFSGREKVMLLDGLHRFVVQRRFSENTETLTAVGSAIRKFAMNMDASDLARYGDLFDYSDTEHLSCQVELELVKAAGWRLAELPRAEIKDSQKLEQRILEIVEAYLPPKLLLQKNYTAIVLNGLTALALLDSAKVDPLIDRVASLEASGKPVVWFRELLADRLREVAKQQDKCDPLRGVKLERWAQELDPATV